MNDTQPADVMTRFFQVLHEVETVTKNAEADTGKYVMKYADINVLLRTLKPILARNGLALFQPVKLVGDGHWMIETCLINETGDVASFPGPIAPIKGDPQATGGTVTYFRRYALQSLFALEVEDDDAQQAHRAAVDPNNRTPAETETRRLITEVQPDEDRHRLVREFKDHFGVGLIDLPEHRHGDALGWVKQWIAGPADDQDAEHTTARQEEGIS